MALMSYLTRDTLGTYYFRRVVPPALRPFMPAPWTGKANWKRSLGTKEPGKAKRATAKHLANCMADFELAERAKRGEVPIRSVPSATAIIPEDIERDVLADLLAEDEITRSDGDARKLLQTSEEREQWPDLVAVEFGRRVMAKDYQHAHGEELVEMEAEYRDAMVRLDPQIVDAETRMFLRQRGLPIDPREPHEGASSGVP